MSSTTVCVEGVQVSTAPRDISMTLRYELAGGGFCTDQIKMTVVRPDIGYTDLPEAKEVNTGGFLVLNDIHSNGNLVDVTLTINGDLAGATVRLQHVLGRGKIKVYEGAIEITEWPHTWPPGTFSNPTTVVKVEGVQVSSLREVGMTLRYEPAGGGPGSFMNSFGSLDSSGR